MSSTGAVDPRVVAEAANRAGTFQTMTHDDDRPTVTVAGVRVALYVDSAHQVCVSVDLDETDSWLLRNDTDCTVPLRICVQGTVTFDG